MERRTMKKKSLKKRILISITFVLMSSMVISTVVSYLYFSRIVRNQVFSDERAKLEQASNQIQFMTNDIRNFTRSIIVDDEIQSALQNITYDSTYDRVVFDDCMAKQLVFYNSLRPYIWSSFIRIEDGTFYGGTNPQSDGDMERKFQSEEMQNYVNHPEWVYSDAYGVNDTLKPGKVVCFRADMMDVTSFGTKQGTLYLEVYLKYFIEQMGDYAKKQENICLVGNDNQVLFIKDAAAEEFFENQEEQLTTGTYKTKQGYVLSEEIQGTGWKLCTILTKQSLLARSNFVLVFFFISCIVSITLTLLVTSRLMTNMIRPITKLSKQMEQMDYQALRVEEMIHTGDEIETLYECYLDMLEEIRSGISRQMDYEKQKTGMEFDIMLSQINPHYIYNVLNTVMYLAAARKDTVIMEIVRSLIYTLQETIKVGEKNIETTIQKELELTECYMNIQKYRYPDMFSVKIQCNEELKNCMVAKMIIQPLVENAILHGIIPSDKAGTIWVRIQKQGDQIYITVEDDGVGITEQGIQSFERGEDIAAEENGRRHIGVRNIKDRIQYLYGAPYGMWIRKRVSSGTVVEIRLPVQ